jgi:hypothetical protein
LSSVKEFRYFQHYPSAFLFSPTSAKCPTHPIILDLTTLVILANIGSSPLWYIHSMSSLPLFKLNYFAFTQAIRLCFIISLNSCYTVGCRLKCWKERMSHYYLRNFLQDPIGSLERKVPYGRHNCKQDHSKDVEGEIEKWILLTHVRILWRTMLNKILNLQVSWMARSYLPSWAVISLSRKIPFHGDTKLHISFQDIQFTLTS